MFFSSLCFSLSSIVLINSCSNVISNYEQKLNVERVVDGDTFSSSNQNYRILGIDTPETKDSSNDFNTTTGPQYFYGNLAKNVAISLLKNKYINVEIIKKDKYERNVSRVTLEGGIDFASYMIENGYAVVRYISTNKNDKFYYSDKNYINNLYKLQKEAKTNKVGFWSEDADTLNKIYPGFSFLV